MQLYSEQPPRGEYVLVLEGAPEPEEEEITLEAALQQVQALIASGCSKKDAVKQTAAATGFPKNLLYDAAIKHD